MANKPLRILQNNIQSIRPIDTRESLYTSFTKNMISAAILQEIWLKEGESFCFKSFKLISKRRKEGWGGVGVLLKSEAEYKQLEFAEYTHVEVVGVEVLSYGDPVKLVSIYVPPGRLPVQQVRTELTDLFGELNQLTGKVVIGGDFNAHHPEWSPLSKSCPRGAHLSELIADSKFCLMNKGESTTIALPDERDSAIDLTLVSADLAPKVSWRVQDEEFGSKHLAIWIDINSAIPVAEITTKRISEERFLEFFRGITPQYIYDPQEMQDVLEQAIEHASFIVRNKKANFLKPWWTEEIDKLYERKKAALKMYNQVKSRSNYILLQKERAIFKGHARRAKREYNLELSEKIDEGTPARQLWNIVRGIDTALTDNCRKRTSISLEKGKQFMSYYYDNKLQEVPLPIAIADPEMELFDAPLSVDELLENLHKKKSYSAPGVNRISYKLLQKMDFNFQVKICEMLSKVYQAKVLPDTWRLTEVRPIPKKGADPDRPNSRRPIALMNVELKLINAVVKDRLNQIAEAKKIIPDRSFGFRKRMSSTTCVNYVVNAIKEVQDSGREVMVAFLDVSMAYDSVRTDLLLETLARYKVPQQILTWLHEYLRKRTITLNTTEGEITVEVSEGLPQGCPAAPTCFNYYTAPLHELSNERCELVQYADDFAVIASGRSVEEAAENLASFLNVLVDKLGELNLRVSSQKSAVIPFTRKRVDHIKIKVKGNLIEMVNTHMYLGYTLDRVLSHRKHIMNVRHKASEKLGLVKMLARKSGRAHPATIIKIGNAIIRSRMEYGCTIYGNAAKTNLSKLQTLQNSYIRIAMNYLRSTPIQIILADSGQIPMCLRFEALAKRELVRSVYFRTPLLKFISSSLDKEIPNGSYITEIADKHADLVYLVHPSDKNRAREMYLSAGVEFEHIVRPELGGKSDKKEKINPAVWRAVCAEELNNRYKYFVKIYTDASKTSTGTAIAVYDQQDEEILAEKINDNSCISNAELLGLLKALEMIKRKKYKKAVILTDSRSACLLLLNKKNLEENYVAWEIYKELKSAAGQNIKIQWIPSHCGIPGNETADLAAKQKTVGPQTFPTGITLGDCIILSKKEIWCEWTAKYKEESKEKGKWHYVFQKNPGRQIWTSNLNLNPEQIRILNRVRSGHTLTKERRKLWALEEDELCEFCEEVENLKHVLYDCPKYNNIRSKYNALEYMKPLAQIFEEDCEQSMKEVVRFIKEANIQV